MRIGVRPETNTFEPADDEPRLVVDVGGFEGPLDLLLDLARRQRVDLHEISILALAEQYLAFIEDARGMRLELAADYLVMAAWLAFLKSRLLLPEPPKPEGPSAADLATALADRLRRLDLIRRAALLLGERPQLGRDVFARPTVVDEVPAADAERSLEASLFDLLSSYARQTQRRSAAIVTVARRQVWSLADARAALEALAGDGSGWTTLSEHLAGLNVAPALRRSALASSFAASLELAREGRLELRQDAAFAPLAVRPRPARVEIAA